MRVGPEGGADRVLRPAVLADLVEKEEDSARYGIGLNPALKCDFDGGWILGWLVERDTRLKASGEASGPQGSENRRLERCFAFFHDSKGYTAGVWGPNQGRYFSAKRKRFLASAGPRRFSIWMRLHFQMRISIA